MFGRLLRTDLYRMRKTTALYIFIVLAFVVCAFFSYVLLRIDVSVAGLDEEDYLNAAIDTDTTIDSAALGYTVGSNANYEMDESDYSRMIWGDGFYYGCSIAELNSMLIQAGYLILFNAIFVCVFMGNEFKSGFYKNFINTNGKRHIPILSHFTMFAIETAILIIVNIITTIFGDVIFNDGIIGDIGLRSLLYVFMSWIMLYGVTCFFVAMMYIARKKTIPLIVGICISLDLHSLIFSNIDRLIAATNPNSTFRFMNYILTHFLQEKVFIDSSSDVMIKAFALSLVYIIISIGVSVLSTSRRDFK